MAITFDAAPKIVYFHRDLPPLSADVCDEDTIDAKSYRCRQPARRIRSAGSILPQCEALILQE